MTYSLFTIGYHPFSPGQMLKLLKENDIGALVDVRAWPKSSLYPDFNQENFAPFLKKNGIYHLSMGKGLGVRPDNPELYAGNRVDYEKIAIWETFVNDLARLRNGVEKFPVCLMCKEADPAYCHRAVLIAWQFNRRYPDIPVWHILDNGSKISQGELDAIIMGKTASSHWLLPENREKEREKAYKKRGYSIAWKKPASDHPFAWGQ